MPADTQNLLKQVNELLVRFNACGRSASGTFQAAHASWAGIPFLAARRGCGNVAILVISIIYVYGMERASAGEASR